jgi:arsenate reductase (thioredoxin)
VSKPLVLSVSTGKSAFSIMAEAMLHQLAGDGFEACSAGLEPKGVNPLTTRVLGEASERP